VRVLLVDTDLRAPSVAKSLGLKPPLGLVDAVLADQYCFDDVVKQSPLENLFVLPAGAPYIIPYEILQSDRMEALIQEARRRYDYVVLDAPPLIPFPDCQLLSQWSDGVLVVVAAHQTSRKMLEEAINVIGASQVLGFVFNGDVSAYSRYYHSRYYHYAARSSSIKNRGRLAQWAAKFGLSF